MLTVYSKNDCPFCTMAKGLLDTKNIAYEEINIMEDTNAREMIINAGHRTVPQIYYKGEIFVEGGYQGLKQLEHEDLVQKLNECSEGWGESL